MSNDIREQIALVKALLGRRVSYVRVALDGTTGTAQNVEGEGILTGFFLSLDNHLQVRVVDDKTQINIDPPAINASPEEKRAYFDHVHAIHARAEQINTENKALVAKGNAEITAMNLAYLGEPIAVEESQANDNQAVH